MMPSYMDAYVTAVLRTIVDQMDGYGVLPNPVPRLVTWARVLRHLDR